MTLAASIATDITRPIRKFKKTGKCAVLELCEQIASLEQQHDAIHEKLSSIAEGYSGSAEEFYEPSITCFFPAFPDMDKRGLKPEPPRKVDSVNKVRAAGILLQSIAYHYGNTERQEALNLSAQWESEIKKLLGKIDDFKNKSGYLALEAEADKLYDEAWRLRGRMHTIAALSEDGLLQQIADIKNWIHSYEWEKVVKLLDIIAEGVRNISK